MESNVSLLFKSWAEQDSDTIIQLLNRNNEPVGALYLHNLDLDEIAVCISNTNEKYYLYINGIAIFFSSYRKTKE